MGAAAAPTPMTGEEAPQRVGGLAGRLRRVKARQQPVDGVMRGRRILHGAISSTAGPRAAGSLEVQMVLNYKDCMNMQGLTGRGFSPPVPAKDGAGDQDLFAAEVERWLTQTIAGTDHPLLRRAAQYLCLGPEPGAASGKRIRPRLVWAFAHCLDQPPQRVALLDVAVAAELIHSGSLLHDDVLDQGQLRRGRKTVNVRWGNTVAVLAGDMMLVRALALLRDYPPAVCATAVETVASMTEAVISEVEARGQLGLSPEHWRGIASGKTGALFGWCGRAVALLAGAPEAAEDLARCGRALGIAFQLADDLIDLVGDRSGKTRYSDLRNRELSYPILVAAASSAEDRAAITALWQTDQPAEEAVRRVGRRLLAGVALSRTVLQISRELEGARRALAPYRRRAGGLVIERWAEALGRQFVEPTIAGRSPGEVQR
jgi:geranylgeranyl pyrophosphate synthase